MDLNNLIWSFDKFNELSEPYKVKVTRKPDPDKIKCYIREINNMPVVLDGYDPNHNCFTGYVIRDNGEQWRSSWLETGFRASKNVSTNSKLVFSIDPHSNNVKNGYENLMNDISNYVISKKDRNDTDYSALIKFWKNYYLDKEEIPEEIIRKNIGRIKSTKYNL